MAVIHFSFFFSDATVSQVSIAWLLYQPTVASVVIGARTLEQLEENMRAVNVDLSKEEVSLQLEDEAAIRSPSLPQLQLLDECSKESVPYPYEMVFRLQRGRERAPNT